jgi:hypothetical protein
MSINFEQLIVGLVFLVPGFISTAAEKTFQPRRFDSAYAWTSSSLVRSIGLNVLGIVVIVFLSGLGLISSEILPLRIENISEAIRRLPLGAVLSYIAGLYAFSTIWGSVIGIYPQLTLKAQANRLKLTSLGPHHSVWRRIRDVQRPKDRPFTWLKIHSNNGKVIFGRLLHASAIIEQDKPIELFLRPAYEIYKDQLSQFSCMGQQADGIYIRLGTADIVEFYFNAEEIPPTFLPDIAK